MGAARVRLKGSMTGGKRVVADWGLLKRVFIKRAGVLARLEKSQSLAIGSSPAPRSADAILPAVLGLLNVRIGEPSLFGKTGAE